MNFPITDEQVARYKRLYSWDPLVWNLRMWTRSRGYIEYFRRDPNDPALHVQLAHYKYIRSQIVNNAFKEYESWASV